MAETTDTIVTDLSNLLSGNTIESLPADVTCESAVGFVAKTKSNVCYITGAVLFNENGEVLMIQEAKDSCRGTWYLPMGRLERGESLQTGAVREVLEETGLQFKPTALLSVDLGNGSWYRVIFSGIIIGGRLKTLADKDEESLQAAWMKYEEVIDATKRTIRIRASDIIHVIELGYKHHLQPVSERVPDYLPSTAPHKQLLFRCVLLHHEPSGEVQVLVNTSGRCHFPTTVMSPRDFSLDVVLFRLLQAVFNKSLNRPEVCGILALEYSGKPPKKNDGICLTALCRLKTKQPEDCVLLADSGFSWESIPESEILDQLNQRLQKHLFIPLSFS